MSADVPGTVYLLCFPGGVHCTGNRYSSHYLGWCNLGEEERRVAEHLRGQGSPLVKAAIGRGMMPVLARTWHDVTRNDERRLKRQRNLARYCPNCVAKTGRKLAEIPRHQAG